MGFPNWPYPYYPCEDPQERQTMDENDENHAYHEWADWQQEEEEMERQLIEAQQRPWRGLFGEIFLFDSKNPLGKILKWLFGG